MMPAHIAEAGRPRDAPSPSQLSHPRPARSRKSEPDASLIAESVRTPERFAEIYDRYFDEIHRYVAGRLGRDAADDLAAETFIDAFRKRTVFDPARGAIRPWLYGIATTVVARHRRTEARRYNALARVLARSAADLQADDQEDQVAARVSAQARRKPLARALARLSDDDRDVLLLVALADLSYDEVAAALSIPAGTVGSRLNRARRKVREALGAAAHLPGNDNGHCEGGGDAAHR
jgi:RNA polymerase sigma-70 factor, ECF subfamily